MSTDEKYMNRCLQLAELGLGYASPNPLVGSVVVLNDRIIGEGYHQKAGEAHAEINAMNSVGDSSQFREATLYVNLEPCAHFGKTPPCSDAIIRNGLKRVVIGITDPNEKVAGKGIRRLEQAGIEVTSGVLLNDCRSLNRRFLTTHEKKRPYIVLKWAQSNDGFIDRSRSASTSLPARITNKANTRLVHQWRSTEDAILIGTNTALLDNPQLNLRFAVGSQPLRVVIDKELRLPSHLHLFDQSQPTLVLNSKQTKRDGNISWIQIDFKQPENEIMQVLFKHEIQSVLIEGGTRILNSFIETGLWDEARIFTSSENFSTGHVGPAMPDGQIQVEEMNGQVLTRIRNTHNNFDSTPDPNYLSGK
jgi:diaminohydroxyphosphoribosylaminopyrimidine deaminase / 5-amino-6-(5-phosphoribosylamino)uracil reductase